jgi:hypothetical protein
MLSPRIIPGGMANPLRLTCSFDYLFFLKDEPAGFGGQLQLFVRHRVFFLCGASEKPGLALMAAERSKYSVPPTMPV